MACKLACTACLARARCSIDDFPVVIDGQIKEGSILQRTRKAPQLLLWQPMHPSDIGKPDGAAVVVDTLAKTPVREDLDTESMHNRGGLVFSTSFETAAGFAFRNVKIPPAMPCTAGNRYGASSLEGKQQMNGMHSILLVDV